MTQRSTVALIAFVAFVLVAVLPVWATYYDINNRAIQPGGTVYIGTSVNMTLIAATAHRSGDDSIGWWAPAASLTTTAPTAVYPLSTLDMESFDVSPAQFGCYLGNWYGVKNGMWDGRPPLFNVQCTGSQCRCLISGIFPPQSQ